MQPFLVLIRSAEKRVAFEIDRRDLAECERLALAFSHPSYLAPCEVKGTVKIDGVRCYPQGELPDLSPVPPDKIEIRFYQLARRRDPRA